MCLCCDEVCVSSDVSFDCECEVATSVVEGHMNVETVLCTPTLECMVKVYSLLVVNKSDTGCA